MCILKKVLKELSELSIDKKILLIIALLELTIQIIK